MMMMISYSSNNYNIHFEWPEYSADTCRKCQGKKEIVQPITCCTLTSGDYTHHHSQVGSVINQELAIKCGLSKGKLALYYKYEPQSALGNS
jgi:hypothetical protein